MRILIDECLSPELSKIAHAAGYEAYHVNYRNWNGLRDWELRPILLDEEFTFVTTDATDWRDLLSAEPHSGLILLMDAQGLQAQRDLFQSALDYIAVESMANRVIEVFSDSIIKSYTMP